MEASQKKFIEFNGTNIYFTNEKGVWYIAVRPICEALGVDYPRQHKNLMGNAILGSTVVQRTMVAADGKMREMLCIPEFYVYGWLFTIHNENEAVQQFQWKCYELLYNYFHGALTERVEFLRERTLAEMEVEKLQAQLNEEISQSPTYIKLRELKNKKAEAKKHLWKLDRDIVTGQLSLWQAEEEVLVEPAAEPAAQAIPA